MSSKIADLTTDELKQLIANTIEESVNDAMEDFVAQNSPAFIQSIIEARNDYKCGRTTSLDDAMNA